ncbi:hypothetical protein RS130_12180 [Paraglaciecola aquimarina]|uniref:Uncharacterized protein n=1 Tax=Paraglaciecola aquimarina TaxID=1235557 RepID=A0ABU3SX46_9ALTE|nr:hypothetical protein [Paraglaciecola aquimarina]MDU0354579.1 hypothetical protein [Paraglaciecola aquimarina]
MSPKTSKETVLVWQQAYQKLLSSGAKGEIFREWQQVLLNKFNIESDVEGGVFKFLNVLNNKHTHVC